MHFRRYRWIPTEDEWIDCLPAATLPVMQSFFFGNLKYSGLRGPIELQFTANFP
jgi:hypothetical protein